jgi:peroxiredoxin
MNQTMNLMKKNILFLLLQMMGLSFSNAQSYQLGSEVSNFTLPNTIDGKNVSLQDYSSTKGLVVIFTCNHCPFSKMYEQRIIDLHQNWNAKGFPVLAISSNDAVSVPDDSPQNMKNLALQRKYPFPYLYDESQSIAKLFGAQRTPHVFILKNKEKKFVLEYIGAIDDNAQDAKAVKEKFVEKALEELSQNKEVSTKSVKAIGCTIKWK